MPLKKKNAVPTSFKIDLSTIDQKMEKLVKYLSNCNIDCKDDGLRFINHEVNYDSLIRSFKNKRYKETLSTLVDRVYTERFIQTRTNLSESGVIGPADFLISGPVDDFGSRFDAFAATNTDPDNSILQALNVNPYKFLKVDILTEKEVEEYSENISSTYDVDRLQFSLKKLQNITFAFLDTPMREPTVRSYIDSINKEVLSPSLAYNLVELCPGVAGAVDLFEHYIRDSVPEAGLETLQIVDFEVYSGISKEIPQQFDFYVMQKAKIRVIDYIIREAISQMLENKFAVLSNIDNHISDFQFYDFVEQKFSNNSVDLKVSREDITFKCTFYREEPQLLLQQAEQETSDTKIEFNLLSTLNIQSPFGASEKNNRFVALISARDLSITADNDFFEPTVLSILSDIVFISNNIFEIDPFYCPTPESLQPTNQIRREEYIQNEVITETSLKNKYFVDSIAAAFTYYTFPDMYFIPNELQGPEAFFDRSEPDVVSRYFTAELIRKASKYYYYSESETPAAVISRDAASRKLFENISLQNGFYGLYEARKDSFADPFSIQQTLNKVNSLTVNSVSRIQDLVFAKTNIACLLKEFQTCFMPKIGNCRDVLRGFRFSELETLTKKAFPESIYPTLFDSIKQLKSDRIKDERERELLQEISALETKLDNNDRKKIIFRDLDKKLEPATALNNADREIGTSNSDDSNKKQLEAKLLEYKELRQSLDLLESDDEMQILKDADQFIQTLEDNGINIDILCDLARFVNDLSAISFTFGTITLPELPAFDIFQETKLSIDLAIAELIFQTLIAFILKILDELLTCNGIKDLVKAGLTGESNSLSGKPLAVINQMARGKFDLDASVREGTQSAVRTFDSGMSTLANGLSKSITISERTTVAVEADLGFLGEANFQASEANSILVSSMDAAVSEKEITIELKGLVSGLAAVMTPLKYVNLIGGKSTSDDLVYVSSYIKQNHPRLSYLAKPASLKAVFAYMSDISGLRDIRDDLINVASVYSNSVATENSDVFCLDGDVTLAANDINADPNLPSEVPADVAAGREKYRDLIRDLLSSSPDRLKGIVDEQVFKPILSGMLPNGKPVSAVDVGNKKTISSTFKNISGKFKENANGFYSKLALKKAVKRDVTKNITSVSPDGDESEVENPEHKNLVNLGLEDKPVLTLTEEKYVYGGVFSENFPIAAETLDIVSTSTKFDVSINGGRGYTSKASQDFFNNLTGDTANRWKITRKQTAGLETFSVLEGSENKFVSKFSMQTSSGNAGEIAAANSVSREYSDLLFQSFRKALKTPPANVRNVFDVYAKDAYDKFISSIYGKVTSAITEDKLLQPLKDMPIDDYVTGIQSGLDAVGMVLGNGSQPVGAQDASIDTSLKYINFCPKPTREQKARNIDPGLYGPVEITKLTNEILQKRNSELINIKTLKEMLQDDNALNFAIIDGLYVSMIRAACADACLRSLFVLRTFKFDAQLLEDLLFATYVSQTVVNEIEYFANHFKKTSFMGLTMEHIEYIHDFLFKDEIEAGEREEIHAEIRTLTEKIALAESDRRALLQYKNRLDKKNIITPEYNVKLDDYITCLKKEIKTLKNDKYKLQVRNITLNELTIMLDKLSYITSTNKNAVSGNACADNTESLTDNDFLKSFISDSLLKSELFDVTRLSDVRRAPLVLLQSKQRVKFQNNNGIFLEHYIRIPLIKPEFAAARREQDNEGLYGVRTLLEFKSLMGKTVITDINVRDIQDIFVTKPKYGVRVIYSQEKEPHEDSFIEYNEEKSQSENFKNYLRLAKNKLYLGDTSLDIAIITVGGKTVPISVFENTYAVPFVADSVDGKKKIGVVNCFPIVSEEIDIPANFKKSTQMRTLMDTIINDKTSEIPANIRKNLLCNEDLTKLYAILTNKNLLSNLMIISSMNILGSKEIITPFASLRFQILNDITTKFHTVYNRDNNEAYEEMIATMSSSEFFKTFNAEIIIKTAIRAAIYVLQYYCQMTDPNISLALTIRNAVKIALSLASQVPNPFGDPLPSELPPPLAILAPYSMGQLPINVFGVPPAGFGVGAPLTIPGMVLLGAELLLLNLEFSTNIENAVSNEKIKDALKTMCIDIEGYKKYGI